MTPMWERDRGREGGERTEQKRRGKQHTTERFVPRSFPQEERKRERARKGKEIKVNLLYEMELRILEANNMVFLSRCLKIGIPREEGGGNGRE